MRTAPRRARRTRRSVWATASRRWPRPRRGRRGAWSAPCVIGAGEAGARGCRCAGAARMRGRLLCGSSSSFEDSTGAFHVPHTALARAAPAVLAPIPRGFPVDPPRFASVSPANPTPFQRACAPRTPSARRRGPRRSCASGAFLADCEAALSGVFMIWYTEWRFFRVCSCGFFNLSPTADAVERTHVSHAVSARRSWRILEVSRTARVSRHTVATGERARRKLSSSARVWGQRLGQSKEAA